MMGMGHIGLPGLLMILLFAALVIIPFWKLLPKFGYSAWLSILAIVPLGALILIWILAFSNPKSGGAE